MYEEDRWGQLNCKQLKVELRKRGLSVTGNKTVLISRLCGYDSNNNNVDDGRADGERVVLTLEDRENDLRERFGSLRVCDLKVLLQEKNASLKGKKQDLISRLVYYELNSNFNTNPNDDLVELANPLDVPSMENFKDIHAGSPLPSLSVQDIELYLSLFQKRVGKAEGMYREGFLEYIRFCNADSFTYIYGKCYAEMKKAAKYDVFCKLSSDGEVQGCTCECTHGKSSGEAHCKHVTVALLAVVHVQAEGIVTTELSCTQQLQTFHHPKKKFRGTPLKSRQLKAGNVHSLQVANEENEEDETAAYRVYFRNIIINGAFNSAMPLKHLIEPANPYAIHADHDYSKCSTIDLLLDSLRLRKVSPEEIVEIEAATRVQSLNPRWFAERESVA